MRNQRETNGFSVEIRSADGKLIKKIGNRIPQ
jgi:hypothetical protein